MRSSVLCLFVPSKLATESLKSSKSQTGRATKPKRLVRSPRVVRWSPRRVHLGMVWMPVRQRMPRFVPHFCLLAINCWSIEQATWCHNCCMAFGRIGRPLKTSILGSFSNPRSGAVYVWILPYGLRKLYVPSLPFGRLISSWHHIAGYCIHICVNSYSQFATCPLYNRVSSNKFKTNKICIWHVTSFALRKPCPTLTRLPVSLYSLNPFSIRNESL